MTNSDHAKASDILDLMIRNQYSPGDLGVLLRELQLVIAHMEGRLRGLEDWYDSKQRSL